MKRIRVKKDYKRKIRKNCYFCKYKIDYIDYKEVELLKKFTNANNGQIVAKKNTGTCTKHQRWLSVAIKRAREVALLPFVID